MTEHANEKLRVAMLEVVDRQLEDGEPEETGATYKRLLESGHSDIEARRLIAIVVGDETLRVIKEDSPYQAERFARLLRKLPALPWD